MKRTIQLPDEIDEQYEQVAAQLGGKVSVEEVMSAQLQQFAKVRPTDRIIVVDTRSRDRLEQLLPGGSLRDAADLVSRVDRLAKVEIGEVRVPFTVTELEELAFRARRQGRKVKDLVSDAVASFHDHYFNYPDSRVCAECERRKAASALSPPTPPVEHVRDEPPPPLVDIAGKVALDRSAGIAPTIRPIPGSRAVITGGVVKR